jgi:hypothetical protein
MEERIKFTITKQGLQLKFEDADKKDAFIKDMQAHDIALIGGDSDNTCNFSPFLSAEGRFCLNFLTTEQKFFFKERTGLKDEQFMDMGVRYETQMHFNHLYLPCMLGATMETVRKIEPPPPGFSV